MLYINDRYYTEEDLKSYYTSFENIAALKNGGRLRIAVCTTNVLEWLALFFYIKGKGGSVVPIHASSPRQAAIRIAKKASSHLLIDQSVSSIVHLSEAKLEEEGRLVQFSSGSTGAPKCIERTWLEVEKEVDEYVKRLPVGRETTPIIACPVTHSYGLISGVMTSLKRGIEPIIIASMNPKYILRKLREYPNHLLYASPSLLYSLVSLLTKGERLHMVMTSGALMPSSWLASLRAVSDQVFQQYGCSEAGCVAIQLSVTHPQQMGIPLSHVRVRAGEIDRPSEIIVETENKTIHTNDLGYFAEDGTLHFVSRIDDVINVAGLNVYPQEVEDVLMEEPRVKEAIVYKKADLYAGERVCALFTSYSPVSEMELRKWCQARLAPYQIPVEWKEVIDIPKLANGKVNRKMLSEVHV
ncbi:AMP-binding protein [Anoxybacillus sp. EFIL]|uniref:AMP-binding protein n=1 Tax=Anoxybacillus sp. EFIL TaxID=2508869 RepID=UPI00148C8C6B|nr:AMP-binding protein [Anoxybacillus sp. EFIL]NNU97018.1 acyl-CoA synthase [Anoxybacillus sp. EFIL]